MKVLLAVDSAKSSHVIETAIAQPWPSDTQFFVLSVVDLRHWEGLPALIEDAKREAQSIVKTAADKLIVLGRNVSSETPQGNPKELIPGYAEKWKVDLVMVGSHGNSKATRFLLGNTAQSVLHEASCSVEIVRQRQQRESHGLKLLLATDGSACSEKAVQAVADRPWPPQSEIRILSVAQLLTADVPSFGSSMSGLTPNAVDEITRIARSRADDAIAAARKALTAAGQNVSMSTPTGEPRATILDEAAAWNADLIVLGSHGRHGLQRILLGSVAEFVAEYAKCSVEIVR
jgi:nucleotide-binding universal stress UspA family protein